MKYILHIDCDAFYASCEEIRNPKLKKRPMAVGGLTNKSIITTANYEARKFGIHSAMPVFMARDLCPNLILVKVDHPFYRKKSQEVFDLVKIHARLFEQVSIDEAYIEADLDNPLTFAKNLQEEILDKTQIPISIGISYNKFLAKLASDWNKPYGIKYIGKDDLDQILPDLPVGKVHGIGRRATEKLNRIGVYKVADLLKLDKVFLEGIFGKGGDYIYNVIRGIDHRPVNPTRDRKSIGKERTFRQNTNDPKVLKEYLRRISDLIEIEMIKKDIQAKTVSIKLKDENFKNQTRSITLQEPIFQADDIYEEAVNLLDEAFKGEYIRLIGISLSNLSDRDVNQLTFL
ncbi:DNA polymerase IV [Anaerococcus degeneri]|uniref:DNA polymerase IV n=1 Tax=Anaerococcus degeneri TaxID=361500 RepID=A0ABS7YVD0_9FIRM|nr:DNA polymerase IV [Anaerococcus degeneri]MBP2015947.1 DNA polymerase-4 [Anaerococcus degeneri]MCA2095693.1 DNA polymerase IV [Anaerococcus degeneri]